MSAERGDGPIDILLVEDNPGDARYIREVFAEVGELSERTAAGGAVPDGPTAGVPTRIEGVAEDASAGESANDGSTGETGGKTRTGPTIVHETRLADGLERFEAGPVDVVLLDLNLPDSKGLDTVEAFRERAETVPVVVLTGLSERKLGIEALRSGAEEYLVKDEIGADTLVRSVHHAIERKANERALQRQRDQLATLNDLNELVHEISHVAIEASSREEIERFVCEQLAASESYAFAWIGDVARDHETVALRAAAGAPDGFDATEIRTADGDADPGPVWEAIRTGEVQVAQRVRADPVDGRRREHAERYGYRSAAAIPIEHEETLYGVLTVYSERPDAFETDERTVVGRVGEVVGHAINAIERKRALMSEEVVEVRLKIEDVLDTLGIQQSADGEIRFERTVPASGDGVYLMYGTVTTDAFETLQALVDGLSHFDSLKVLDEREGDRRFELRLTEPPAIAAAASSGGRVESARISDGDYRMTVHLPPSADVGRVVDAIRESYPETTVIAQRHVTRSGGSAGATSRASLESLTEKQRSALESAYFSGFFEWPRDSSGEEVADSLDVSPPTFHQHLRTAERKLLATVFREFSDLESTGSE